VPKDNFVRKCKIGEGGYFESDSWDESGHQDNNDNSVRIIKFATLKNLDFTSSMFPHQYIDKYTWTSPDGKTRHNPTDHIPMLDRRLNSSTLVYVLSWEADCDTDHCLVVAKIREILAVSKQAAQTFGMERFNLRKLCEMVERKQYQIKISNRFAASENLNDSEEMYRCLENIKENIKTLAKERVFVCMNRRFDEGNFMTFRSKEAGQSAVVTSSKPK
jgi:hypothetical protein